MGRGAQEGEGALLGREGTAARGGRVGRGELGVRVRWREEKLLGVAVGLEEVGGGGGGVVVLLAHADDADAGLGEKLGGCLVCSFLHAD